MNKNHQDAVGSAAGAVPSVSVQYAQTGVSTRANALGMRPMQERAYEKRGEQYLLIKSPPASGKSRALMFIALDKLANQGMRQAIIVVPEKSIGASFDDEPLSEYGFWADWHVAPKWNLCNAPGTDNGGKVKSLGAFLDSDDRVLICTHVKRRKYSDGEIRQAGSSRPLALISTCLSVIIVVTYLPLPMLEVLYDHHDPIQSRVEPGRDTGEEGHQERPGVHHGSW